MQWCPDRTAMPTGMHKMSNQSQILAAASRSSDCTTQKEKTCFEGEGALVSMAASSCKLGHAAPEFLLSSFCGSCSRYGGWITFKVQEG